MGAHLTPPPDVLGYNPIRPGLFLGAWARGMDGKWRNLVDRKWKSLETFSTL